MPPDLYDMNPQVYDDYINTEIEKVNFNKVFELVNNFCFGKSKVEILDLCCGTGIFPRNWLIKP